MCPPPAAPALPVYDRELSLSGNATARDAGMLAYIGINGSDCPLLRLWAAAMANPDSYPSWLPVKHAHRVGSRQGCDRQRHQCLRRQGLNPPTKGALTLNADGHSPMFPMPALERSLTRIAVPGKRHWSYRDGDTGCGDDRGRHRHRCEPYHLHLERSDVT